jgi:RNA polymerase sigma factor (sigma-70 family)
MSNVNDLAVKAQNSTVSILPLWNAVRGLVCTWANRRTAKVSDADDLIQAGFLALINAVAGYNPEKGDFITILRFHIRTQFNEASGLRGTKRRPEINAASLDAPLGDGTETTLLDTLADPASDFADGVIEQESIWQDYAALMTEIDKLPDYLRLALMLTCRNGLTYKTAAGIMGVTPEQVRWYRTKAIEKIRSSEVGQQIRRDRYPPRRVGLYEFKTTRTSEVEKHLLWLEERGWLKGGSTPGRGFWI